MSSSVQILALNSDESGFERCKLNASKALTVDASGYTVPISAASALAVTGAFYQETQPVSGSVSISGNVSTVAGSTSVSNSSQFSAESIADGASAQSAGLDISALGSCLLYGDTDNVSDEVDVEISFDNSNWYNLGLSLYPDPDSGNFAKEIESSAKYIRLNKSNSTGTAETITAAFMTKS